MDKELQDLAWSCLPKEFKEEVKRLYKAIIEKSVNNSPTERYFDGGCEYTFEKLFGKHNLTSDAEGEEILTVPRKKVQDFFMNFKREKSDAKSTFDKVSLGARMSMLQELFGSKCLPDEDYTTCVHASGTACKHYNHEEHHCSLHGECRFELNEDNFTSKEPSIEDEEFTYSKIKTGDKVLFNNNICRIIGIDRENAEYQLERIVDNHLMGWAEENEISLYEKPKPSNTHLSPETCASIDKIFEDALSE